MRERTNFAQHPWRQFSLAVLIGTVLGIIGPFGSFERLPLEYRVVQWVVLVAGNWTLTQGALFVLSLWQGTRRPLWVGMAGALIAAAPGAVLTQTLITAWGWMVRGHTSLVEIYLYVAVIGVSITVPVTLLSQRGAVPSSSVIPSPAPAARTEPAFLLRVPARLGRELLALEAEDHYLRVHTPLGSDLVLMRMGDAESELAGLEGMRVHRSWWVARAAVISAERQGQGLRLSLTCGLRVPVSRSKAAELKRAGWF